MIIDSGESITTITFHGVQFTVSMTILGILLKEYKVWTILKERSNQMWRDYCNKHGMYYKSINGDKETH